MRCLTILSVSLCRLVYAFNNTNSSQEEPHVHTMEIDGNQFLDSTTGDRFIIRGIDYQPGGSASYTKTSDSLSDAEVCARDIYLFQELGINTVRVYIINPRLNHDACMTMLAAANIYLLLDINSPLVGESINRYEPWTTYTPDYLRHVFEIVDQFSRYNNTLGFFIGNEVINDERSAAVSPPYIKAVTRDVKDYMYYNCHREVPLGYSAADDLRYRKQLSHYLTCGPRESAVDFYGVNSYQWCGKQTIRTSGYDVLIKDHADFNVPVFFSEFGCNLVKPRLFQEVSTIHSPAMMDTFSGGLVYEFSQEENDYGLVDIDKFGNAFLREDFETLKRQYKDVRDPHDSSSEIVSTISSTEIQDVSPSTVAIPTVETNSTGIFGLGSAAGDLTAISSSTNTSISLSKRSSKLSHGFSSKDQLKTCLSSYPNLSGARINIPDSFGTDMIRNGVRISRGKYLHSILENIPASKYDITRADGSKITGARMTVVNNFRVQAGDPARTNRGGLSNTSEDFSEESEEGADKTVKGRQSKSKESKSSKSNGTGKFKDPTSLFVSLLSVALLYLVVPL